MHARKGDEVVGGDTLNRDMIPSVQGVSHEGFLDGIRLERAGKTRKVGGTQIVRTMTGPKVKQPEGEIIGEEDGTYELQAVKLAVVESYQDDAVSDLRKHAEVDELQEVEE
jgi:hypothetical protein